MDNGDEERAQAGVDVQQLLEMQKEMLEEVEKYPGTVAFHEIGAGIFEASKRVPIFLHDVRGGKQVSSYFGLRQGQELTQVGLNRLRFGSLLHGLSLTVKDKCSFCAR